MSDVFHKEVTSLSDLGVGYIDTLINPTPERSDTCECFRNTLMTSIPIDDTDKLKVIWDVCQTGLVFVTFQGQIQDCNRSFAEFLGYTQSELIGKHFADVTSSRDVSRDLEQFQRLVSGEITSYVMHKYYHPNIGPAKPARLRVNKIFNSELCLAEVYPIESGTSSTGSPLTTSERDKIISQALGEVIFKNKRIWFAVIAAILGAGNIDKIFELFGKMT